MALSYRQVKDLYDQIKSSGATSVSLPEWSDEMNKLTGTDLYAQGQNDNLLKRASVGIDRALEWTGLPSASAGLGRQVGSLVGNPEAGAQIGEGLPRMAVNMLPFLIPGAGWAQAARLGGVGLLAGAEAYTKTGSPASGIVSGALNAALPSVANAAEQAVLRRMGVESLGPIASNIVRDASGNITQLATKAAPLEAETLAQHIASLGAGQGAVAATMEGQRWGEEGFSGQPLHNPFTTENLLNYTLGQAPFLAIHGVTKLTGLHPAGATAEAVTATEKLVEQKRAQDALAQQTDIEKIPPVTAAWTPEQINQLLGRTNELRQQQDAITSKASMTPEDAEKLNELTQADAVTPKVRTTTSALGAEQSSEHVLVAGKQIHETAKWRKILVADDEANPEELRGKVVEYSKGLREPVPKPIEGTDQVSFGVTSDPLWRTVKTVEDEANRQLAYAEARRQRSGAVGPATPELPVQENPATDYFAHVTDLDKIENDLVTAKTPAQKQQVALALRALQERAGKEAGNDIQLARIETKLAKLNPKVDPTEAALKREANKLRRQLAADEEAIKRKAVREDTASETIGENVGTKNQAPLVSLPKLTDTTQATHDRLTEIISGAQTEASAAEDFAQWQKTTKVKDTTSLPLEKERFKIWWRMRNSGDIGNEEQLSVGDQRTFNDELNAEGIGVDNAAALRDFPERDHVLTWNDVVNEKLIEGMQHAPQAQRFTPPTTNLHEGSTGYENVPASLLGFPKEGPTKAFEEHRYPYTLNLEISLDGGKTWEQDAVKGMNRNNAIERARRNWDEGVMLREVPKQEDVVSELAFAPRIAEPKRYVSDVAAQQEIATRLTTDGHGLIAELLQDSDPATVALAKDLQAKFPEALKRIDSSIYDVPGSFAARRPSGRVGIFFDRGVLTSLPFVRNNIALHELIHGLTLHELANPRVDPKVISELTALRERLVKALPKELRSAYDKAVSSEWYDRYVNDVADMSELHPDENKAGILYGLLTNEELASQAFSSRDFRQFMQSVKGTKGNGWKSFTGWVKSLLGLGERVSGTTFDDFLATTSQLMNHGEWLSDFANFGERYLEGRGESASYARGQTDRALGLVANSSFGADEPLTIATALDLSGSQSNAPLELRRARNNYIKIYDNEADTVLVDNILAELGHKDIDEMVTSAIGEGLDISQALDLLPPEATSYVYAKLKDAQDVLGVIQAAASEQNKGMVNLANPALLRKSVEPVLRNVKRALAHEEFQTQMATSLTGMSSIAPDGLLAATPSFAPKVYEDFIEGTKDVGGKSAQAMADFLEPTGQWARRVPEVAEGISKGFQLSANSRKMFHESVKWLGMDTSNPYVDVLTHESVQETEKALANPRISSKISEWMFQNNKKGGNAVTMLPENDPDVAKLLSGLTDDERSVVRDVVAKAGKVTQMLNAQKLEKMNQIAATNGAAVAALSTGLKTRDNVALAGALLEGIQKSGDPMTATDGMVAIQSVQQRMADPIAFTELYDFLRGEADKIKLWKTYFDANPFWATAQRTERYLVRAFDKQGKLKTLQASTPKEANDILTKKGYKLKELEDQWKGREDEPFAFPNLSPDMAKRMQEIEANQMAMLSKSFSPEELAEVQRTSPVAQILREATANQAIPGVKAPPRLLGQGAEELPWMWNHIAWAQREASYWSRQLLRAQARTYLKDVEVRNLPDEEQARLKTHFDNLLMPDPKIAQQITRLNSTWFLGYNLATSIINAAQPFVTHVAELTSLTGKPLDSYSRVMRALDEVGGKFVGKRDWASREHEQLMHEAVKDGEVGIGMFDDEAAAQEAIATNFKRAMKKEAPQTVGQRLGKISNTYSTVGMWLFQHGERVNSRAALLAGFDYYREQGLDFVDAKVKAYEFNHAVNFGGGRAQRPVGAYSSRSPFLRGAAMLGTSLQSYVLGTTFQIARNLQRGFFRPGGLTPHETFAARRAAIQMLATQFAAAGVLGLPFVSGAISLLDKLFPELELNKKTRESVNNIFGGDAENGNVLTDIAMTGVPSMFGWDMQSRLSMGNTLPGVSEVNGFQPENLLGPTGNLIRNFVNGTTGFVKGDAKAGFKFLPPSVAKLIQAGQAALSSGQPGGGIRDYAGRPLASPTPGEFAGSLLGFQPKRLSDQNAAARMLTQSEEVLRTQESRFRSRQAEQVLQGNFGTVRQELLAKAGADKEYDAPAAVQAIARAAESLAFPRDLRREGTTPGASSRNAFLRTFGDLGQVGASEVQRLEFRKQIEARLGLVGDSRNELKVAILMDKLKQADPSATRLELKSAALEASRRASQGRQLLPLESQ